MTTRIRTNGSTNALWKSQSRRSRYKFGSTITDWSAWEALSTIDEGYYLYETMTDVVGVPRTDKPVSHSRTKSDSGIGPGRLEFQTGFSTGYPSRQWEYSLAVPIRTRLNERKDHLGALAGLKALAIARIPAYSATDVTSFISIMEVKECVDSMAVKSAKALARLGYDSYLAAKRGNFKGLGRDAVKALKQLATELGGRSPKDAWSVFLAGLNFSSNANLEWKFGWKPLIEQIQATNAQVEKIAAVKQKFLDGIKCHGTAVEDRSTTYSNVSCGYLDPNNYELGVWSFSGQKTTHRVAHASIKRKLNTSSAMYDVDWFNGLDVVMELNGLKPSRKSLWQLSKMSFVVDWFWNVSSLLESMQTLASPIGSNFTSFGGMYSEKTVTTLSGVLSCSPVPGSKYDFPGTVVYTTYNRAADSLTGGPAFYVPPIRVPTEAGKWFTLAQIFFQTLVRKIP